MRFVSAFFFALTCGFLPEPADAQWAALSTGISDVIYSLYFNDADFGYATGWVSGTPAVTMMTSDGGQTWSEYRHAGPFYFGTTFTSFADGYIAGYDDGGSILRTSNGGATWTHQGFPNGGLYVIEFPTPQIGYTCGYNGAIFKTLNGGDAWSLQETGAGDLVFRFMDFVDVDHGFAVAGTGFNNPDRLYRTTNGGQTWEMIHDFNGSVFGDMHFFDPDTGLIAGWTGDEAILITYDAGETWHERHIGPPGPVLQSLHFVGTRGWAVGNQGRILRTLDRGETWTLDAAVEPAISLLAVFEVENVAYAAGEQGRVYRREVDFSYWMNLTTDEASQAIVDPADGEVTYALTIQNLGEQNDVYEVSLSGTFPEGWSHTIEAVGVSPHESLIQVPVSSQDHADLTVRVNPSGTPGTATLDVRVTTPNAPSLSAIEEFRLMAGLDILLVDDDEGENFETWFEDAIEAAGTGLLTGRWDRALDDLDRSFVEDIDAVVWFTGSSFADGRTLTVEDQLYLQDYLDAGGRLFLTGQGIGFDIRQDPFWTDYLHAQYEMPFPLGQNLTGIADDPVSNGMSFSIVGGSGAGNQSRQHVISSLDESATVIFSYDDQPRDGALRIEADDYRVVYLGFGFEGIADENSRNDLMSRTLDWLIYGLSADDSQPELIPVRFALHQNYPNPFNPSTAISFDLSDPGMTTLTIYNTLGQVVASPLNSYLPSGSHRIRFEGTGLPSGVYSYRLKSGDFTAARRMILLK